MRRISEITSGLVTGSDAIDLDENSINMEYLRVGGPQQYFGKVKKNEENDLLHYIETVKIKDGSCLYDSIKYFNLLDKNELKLFKNQTTRYFDEIQ